MHSFWKRASFLTEAPLFRWIHFWGGISSASMFWLVAPFGVCFSMG